MWQDSASRLTWYLHTLGHKDLPFLEDFGSPWVFVSHGILCRTTPFLSGFAVFCIHLSSFIPSPVGPSPSITYSTDFCLKVVSSILDTDVHRRLEIHKLPKPQTRPAEPPILISTPVLLLSVNGTIIHTCTQAHPLLVLGIHVCAFSLSQHYLITDRKISSLMPASHANSPSLSSHSYPSFLSNCIFPSPTIYSPHCCQSDWSQIEIWCLICSFLHHGNAHHH